MATRKSPSKTTTGRKRAAAPRTTTRTAATTPRSRTAKNTVREDVRDESVVEEAAVVEAPAVTADGRASSRTSVYNRFPVAALIAEFLGTFIFVAFAVVTQVNPLYAFFALIAIVTLFGRLSGPHLNPAISIGAWLARYITGRTALFYIIAQILGGLAAFGVLSLLSAGATTADQYTGAQTAASLYSLPALTGAKEWYIFSGELIGSVIFGFGVASAFARRNSIARGVLYGGSFLLSSFIVYATGAFAVLNPVLAGALKAYTHIDWGSFNLFPVLVYIIAPIVGISLGFGLAKLIERSMVTE